MPQGENLTGAHQRRAASRPRTGRAPKDLEPANGETLDDAVLRYQRAKADTEGLDAEKRALDVARLRGELIPADDARDEIEATHLRWCAEIDQLPHAVASSIPPEVPASLREQIRALVETACLAVRTRIGSE